MADGVTPLAEQLRAVGRALSVQVPDDLADRVLADIASAPVAHDAATSAGRPLLAGWRSLRRSWRRGLNRRARWAAALAALLVAVGVSVAISAPVRAALVHVFGFGGIEIREGPGPWPAPSPHLPGEHITDLETAQREVGFRIRVPTALGRPDSVTVADQRVVSLHYRRAGGSVRIDQFVGDLGHMWTKYAEGPAEPTTVDGLDALWFHEAVILVYVDATGVERPESTRLTGGTLVWTYGGVTFRLDGIRPLEAAVAVARSMD